MGLVGCQTRNMLVWRSARSPGRVAGVLPPCLCVTGLRRLTWQTDATYTHTPTPGRRFAEPLAECHGEDSLARFEELLEVSCTADVRHRPAGPLTT